MRAFLQQSTAEDRPIFGERSEPATPAAARMIRTRQWKLCLMPRGRHELYDLAKDPHEINNVLADPANAAVIERLKGQLQQHMSEIGDPALKTYFKAAAK